MPARDLAVRCIVIAMAFVAAGYPTFVADEITLVAPMFLLPAFVFLQRDGAPRLAWLVLSGALLAWSFLSHVLMGGEFTRLIHTFAMYAPFAVLAFRVRQPARLVLWFAVIAVLLLEVRIVFAFVAAGGEWRPWQVDDGNMLATKLNVLLPVVFVSMLAARDRGEARAPYLVLLGTGALCVILILSRAGIGLLAAICVAALVRWNWRSLIGVGGLALTAWAFAPGAVWAFLSKARFVDFAPIAPRRMIWAEAFDAWRASPWFGVGPGNSSRTLVKTQNYHAHNDVIQATLETGWPVGLLLAGVMAYLATLAVRLFLWGGRSMFWGLSLFAGLADTVVSAPLTRPDFTLSVILVLMVAREWVHE
jgi:O-antigen ligase